MVIVLERKQNFGIFFSTVFQSYQDKEGWTWMALRNEAPFRFGKNLASSEIQTRDLSGGGVHSERGQGWILFRWFTWGSTINSSRGTEIIYCVRYLGVRCVLMAFFFIKSQNFWEGVGGCSRRPLIPSLKDIFSASKLSSLKGDYM